MHYNIDFLGICWFLVSSIIISLEIGDSIIYNLQAELEDKIRKFQEDKIALGLEGVSFLCYIVPPLARLFNHNQFSACFSVDAHNYLFY